MCTHRVSSSILDKFLRIVKLTTLYKHLNIKLNRAHLTRSRARGPHFRIVETVHEISIVFSLGDPTLLETMFSLHLKYRQNPRSLRNLTWTPAFSEIALISCIPALCANLQEGTPLLYVRVYTCHRLQPHGFEVAVLLTIINFFLWNYRAPGLQFGVIISGVRQPQLIQNSSV